MNKDIITINELKLQIKEKWSPDIDDSLNEYEDITFNKEVRSLDSLVIDVITQISNLSLPSLIKIKVFLNNLKTKSNDIFYKGHQLLIGNVSIETSLFKKTRIRNYKKSKNDIDAIDLFKPSDLEIERVITHDLYNVFEEVLLEVLERGGYISVFNLFIFNKEKVITSKEGILKLNTV